MATEILIPDAVLTATNLTANIANLDEGVDNFDGVYATTNSGNANTVLVLSFPTPSGTLTSGVGIQTFRARVRKNANAGNNVVPVIQVRDNGVIKSSQTFTALTNTTPVNLTFNWDASTLDLQTGENVEIAIVQNSGGAGGGANNRRWLETDAADWIANYVEPVVNVGYSFSTIF